jgi:outer membrane protein OmpA-like peptidoglycan-associated protein
MKKILLVIIGSGLFASTFGQDESIKPASLGIHFFFNDFRTASNIRSKGLSSVISSKEWYQTKYMSAGLALSYIKGFSRYLDFAGTLSGSFPSYQVPGKSTSVNTKFFLEATATANLKLVPDNYWVSPFLTAGIGASQYGGYYAALVPLGVGLQVNFFDEAFLLLNSQYRVPITENAAYHFYHSIGIAANIAKKKIPAPVVVPIPVAEPPKDRDGDGILDADDKCLDVKGIASLQGCPDRDGDGITDADDKCPDVAGLARYQGCPIPDTDKDGINDEIDKCVTVPGLARYNGCPIPDTDGDGVNDEEDKCPNRPGSADNYGCPVIGIKSYEIVFKTGSAVLLPKGKKILDTVVTYLNTHQGLSVTVDGHTDNTGSDKINDPLSLKRAEASKAYIVSKGIDPARMFTAGYGSKQPIADNKTAAGRTKNRRIEIKIRD